MEQGAGKKLGKAKASNYEVSAPPRSEVSALELPGAPTGSGVAAPPPPTQPKVDTTRRLHGDVAPSQATALQIPGAQAQPPPAEVAPRRLAIVPAPALAPELKKKNKKHVLPAVRRHTAFLYTKDDRKANKDDQKTKKDDRQTKDDDRQTKEDDRQMKKDVPVIIDGETVPAEIVEGYKRYCRIARSSPATTTVCHLCIFEVELHPNGIVRTSDLIAHYNKHRSVAVRCGRFGCAAKVPPGRDLRWHTHICHDLPADWWLP